jgi:CPA1 family monovalent cation:H+ antiporter
VNSRYLKLAPTIGLMLQAFALSLILIGLDLAGVAGAVKARNLLNGIDFNQILFHGLLSFLLFAGALQVCLACLTAVRWEVMALATIGVALSTLIVGFASYFLLQASGFDLPLGYCLLFGALISPTDPVAVLPIIRRAGVRTNLQALVEGESLFNDGIAVVFFSILLTLVTHETSHSLPVEATLLFFQEAVGGVLVGLALGYLGYLFVRTLDDYPVEILITLALVSGGYALADALGTSGPLAMVVAGIVIGNHARPRGMSARTSENLDRFWEMVDIVLNAVLFVLIGLEAVAFAADFSLSRLLVALAAIPLVLLARFMSVGAPLLAFRRVEGVSYRNTPFLTWAGLRGAIPIALVLSLPSQQDREVLVLMTYSVVVFSILVQGSTLKYFLPRKA